MEQKNINSTNNFQTEQDIFNDFDFPLFVLITKKTLKWILLIIGITITIVFLYLRYTPPMYQASSTLQMTSQNTAQKVLGVMNIYEEEIAQQIELLRSKKFIDKALSNLTLDVSYFSKGKILNNELYSASPYNVEFRNITSSIYNTPIHISFPNRNSIHTSYSIENELFQKPIDLNKWSVLEHVEIKIQINDFDRIVLQQDQFKHNPYFFKINNTDEELRKYYNKIHMTLLNAAAKTIQVTLSDENPQKAADIINAIGGEFVNYDVLKRAESANKVLDFINVQLDTVYDKLWQSENKMHAFKKQNKVTNENDLLTVQVEKLDALESALLQLELEEKLLTKIQTRLSSREEPDLYNMLPTLTGSFYQNEISELLSPIIELHKEKEEQLYLVTPNSEEIKALDYKIRIKNQKLLNSVIVFRDKISIEKEAIKSKINNIEKQFFNLPEKELEYARLLRLFKINEQFYTNLLEKKAEFSISKAGFVSQNEILERASPPKMPITPNKQKIFIIAFVATVFSSLVLLAIRYFLHNEITSTNDISRTCAAPILGVIPEYKKDIPVSQLLVDKSPKSLIAEAFRSIRSNLQFINNEPGPKIIAITSTISGEGKTFIAINLSGIIAFSEKKVIVLDLDLRKPKIHLGFNTENIKGMSTILSGKDNYENCINKSNIKNLDFITAGPVPPNPSELIISKKMSGILETLKSIYDVIIIDNPPIGIVTDGLSLVQNADYPIYVLKANFSKKEYLKNITQLTNQKNLNKLSIVLNGVEKGSGYGYQSNYGYGYTYGYGYYSEENE